MPLLTCFQTGFFQIYYKMIVDFFSQFFYRCQIMDDDLSTTATTHSWGRLLLISIRRLAFTFTTAGARRSPSSTTSVRGLALTFATAGVRRLAHTFAIASVKRPPSATASVRRLAHTFATASVWGQPSATVSMKRLAHTFADHWLSPSQPPVPEDHPPQPLVSKDWPTPLQLPASEVWPTPLQPLVSIFFIFAILLCL